MKFVLVVDCGNDAFSHETSDGPERELGRILSVAANKVYRGEREFRLLDRNGNSVGHAEFRSTDLDPFTEAK